MEQALKDMLKGAVGMTEADMQKLTPNMVKLLSNINALMGNRIVAEVTESKYCFHGLKKGDKIVVEGGKLNVEKTTAPLCMGALSPIDQCSMTLFDRIIQGWKPTGEVFAYARCHDLGVGHGGLGEVYFKVYTQPVA